MHGKQRKDYDGPPSHQRDGALARQARDDPALVPSPNVTDLVVGEVYEISDGLGEVIDRWEREAGYDVRTVKVTSADGEFEAQAYFYASPDRIAQHPIVEPSLRSVDLVSSETEQPL